MIETRRCEAELRWRASPLTRAVATCAGAVLAAAVIGSQWQLVAFVAPLLGVLCSIGWQKTVPKVYVHAEPGLQRCFEGEQTRLSVWATAEPADIPVALAISGLDGMQLDVLEGGPWERQTVAVAAQRWGRYPIRARVEVVAPGGLLTGTATVDAADVFVFPLAPTQSTRNPQDRTARSAGHPPDSAHRARGRIRRHSHLRTGRPVAHGQLAGERAPGQPARHPAVDRPGGRRGRADRHLSATAGSGDGGDRTNSARRRSGGAERTAKRRPGRSRHAWRSVNRAGSVPRSVDASSTGCSTPCSALAMNSKPAQAHWRRVLPSRRARSWSHSRRCSTPNSPCR